MSLSPAFLWDLLGADILLGLVGGGERPGEWPTNPVAEAGFSMPDDWMDNNDSRWLLRRLTEMINDETVQEWLLRAMVLSKTNMMIGHTGFHGPPTEGFAELGYTVFPEHRRQGYALETATGLMEWARRTHGVRRFRLSISPSNSPSLAMAAKLGFVRTGEQMDEEDGLEHVFERDFP